MIYIAITLALIAALATIGTVAFLHHQDTLKMRAHLMREAVRNHEFTFHLPVKGLFYGEKALQEALNDLGDDIGRLVARNEVESWHKLTRVLTHEIMNVTTPIQSISQAYIEHPSVRGTSLEKGIVAINEASRNLMTFVDSYRKLTQLQKPSLSTFHLQDLLSDIIAMYPKVTWKTDRHEDVVLHTDETLLRQVIVNIVKNATEAGAKNMDFAWHDGQLLVSNDGAPIPAEVRMDIFIPFFTTKKSGTGIGLALSRQIMTMQGGALTLSEKARKGYHTTFVLDFAPDSIKTP